MAHFSPRDDNIDLGQSDREWPRPNLHFLIHETFISRYHGSPYIAVITALRFVRQWCSNGNKGTFCSNLRGERVDIHEAESHLSSSLLSCRAWPIHASVVTIVIAVGRSGSSCIDENSEPATFDSMRESAPNNGAIQSKLTRSLCFNRLSGRSMALSKWPPFWRISAERKLIRCKRYFSRFFP